MRVAELIRLLEEYDQDKIVVIETTTGEWSINDIYESEYNEDIILTCGA